MMWICLFVIVQPLICACSNDAAASSNQDESLPSSNNRCSVVGCTRVFENLSSLRSHVQRQHPYSKRYKCDVCKKYSSEYRNILIDHIVSKHSKEAARDYCARYESEAQEFKCPEEGCLMTFPSQDNANRHRKTAHSTKPRSQLGHKRNNDLQTPTQKSTAEAIPPTSHLAHNKRKRRQDDADETLASTQDDVQSTSIFQPHPLHQPSEGKQRKASNPQRITNVERTTSSLLPHSAIQQLQSGEVQPTSSIARNPLDDAIQHHSRKTSNPQRWRRRGETTSPLQLPHSPIEQTQGDEGNGDHEDTGMMTGETETGYLDTSGSVQLVPGDMAIGHSEQSSREINPTSNEIREESQTVPIVSSQGLASMPPEARSKPLYKASLPHSFPHP